MKTILLINPDSYDGRISPPLGLGLIASYIKTKNHYNVKIIDLNIHSNSYLQHYISNNKNNIIFIGISALSMTFLDVINVINTIKYSYPQLKIVLGGVYPSFEYNEILNNYKCIDYVLVGEGEQSVYELAKALENKFEISKVKGLAWRNISNNIPILNSLPDTKAAEYNNIPIDYSFFDNDAYTKKNFGIKTLYLLTSRGCPFNCSFCSNSTYSKNFCSGFRYRPIKVVTDELREYKKFYDKINQIMIYDNDFLINVKRSSEIINIIKKYYGNVKIKFLTRADSFIKAQDFLKECIKLNELEIEVGIESFSNSQLIRYNKKITLLDIEKILNFVTRNKINIDIDLLIFDPFVTNDELLETLNKIVEYGLCEKLEYALFLRCYLYSGTEMTKKAIVENIATGSSFCDVWQFKDVLINEIWSFLQLYKNTLYEKVKELRNTLSEKIANCNNSMLKSQLIFQRYRTYEIAFKFAIDLCNSKNIACFKNIYEKYYILVQDLFDKFI